MDPGEQTTGTRDEHYNLISVLYHALHGAENCETYVADAEAADRGELAAFFREAQAMHAALAEQAKGHLGIGGTTPEEITQRGATVKSGIPTSDGAPKEIAPGSSDVQQEEQPVNGMPDEPPGKRGRQFHRTLRGHKTPHPGRETRRRAPASSRRGRT